MVAYEIETTETKYISGEHSVTVSFQLPYRDWCKLEKKQYWKKIQKFLLKREGSKVGSRDMLKQ